MSKGTYQERSIEYGTPEDRVKITHFTTEQGDEFISAEVIVTHEGREPELTFGGTMPLDVFLTHLRINEAKIRKALRSPVPIDTGHME